MASVVGNYKVTEKIGAGGMAVVYRGEHKVLQTPVAIKVLLPNLSSDDNVRQRFYNEARIMSRIEHQGIVRVLDFLEYKSSLVIVMEYVDGKPLDKVIGEDVGPIPHEKALPIFKQILSAMAYAHEQGVIHRDLKPSNVLVRNDGIVKVTDFGIAKLAGQSKLTKTGTKLGTLCYMSPEQVLGKDLDERADVYSLGATLYEMLAGTMPRGYGDTSEFEVMNDIVNGDLPDPRKYYPHIPPWLMQVMSDSLARNKEERIENCSAFLMRIEQGEKTGHVDGNSSSLHFSSPVATETQEPQYAASDADDSGLEQTFGVSEAPESEEPIGRTSAEQRVPAAVSASGAPPDAGMPEEPGAYSSSRKSKRKSTGWIVPVVLLGLIGAAGIFAVVNKRSEAANRAPAPPPDDPLLFEETYGGSRKDVAWKIIRTSDGGYAMAGYTESYGNQGTSMYLLKVDDEGDREWAQTYSNSDLDQAFSLAQTSDGGFILMGLTSSDPNGDIWVVRTNSRGTLQWSREYGDTQSDWAFAGICDSQGHIVISGSVSTSEENSDIFFISLEEDGDVIGAHVYEMAGRQAAYDIVECSSGYAILGRSYNEDADNGDMLLLRLNSSGTLRWRRTYGGRRDEWGRALEVTDDGGFILAGYTSSYGTEGDAWLVKVSRDGTKQWSRNIGGHDSDWAYDIVEVSGGYVFAGRTASRGRGAQDGWLAMVSERGSLQWQQTFGGSRDDKFYSLVETSSGYAMAGYSESGGDADFYLVSTNDDGEVH